MPDQIDAVHTILADVALLLRKRLRDIGIDAPNMLVAIGPEGDTVMRGEIAPAQLKKMARELAEIAEDTLRRRSAS